MYNIQSIRLTIRLFATFAKGKHGRVLTFSKGKRPMKYLIELSYSFHISFIPNFGLKKALIGSSIRVKFRSL